VPRIGGILQYLHDVEDHLPAVTAQIETYGQILDGILTARLAEIAVKQSRNMRTISSMMAILAVFIMIAEIYGTNFDHIPELRWIYGYPLILTMIGVC
jgi:magnesium transporter